MKQEEITKQAENYAYSKLGCKEVVDGFDKIVIGNVFDNADLMKGGEE